MLHISFTDGWHQHEHGKGYHHHHQHHHHHNQEQGHHFRQRRHEWSPSQAIHDQKGNNDEKSSRVTFGRETMPAAEWVFITKNASTVKAHIGSTALLPCEVKKDSQFGMVSMISVTVAKELLLTLHSVLKKF